jgi:hypothetical protein
VDWVKAKGFEYGMNSKATDDPETWTEIDCTRFAWKALGKFGGPRFSSVTLDGNCYLKRIDPKDTRAGDVLGQPRPKDDPGSQHVGIAQGVAGPKGGHLGTAMGRGGAAAGSVWGLTREDGGSFDGGDQLHVYRPQKRKANCRDGDCKPG